MTRPSARPGARPSARPGAPAALSESLQDYLEAVCLLSERHGVARMKEIARVLGVGTSSATGAIRGLARRGLVHYDPYQYVTLTAKGRARGRELLRRHRVLKKFLMTVLAVPEAEAETVGCKMEHAVRGEVLERFVRFLALAERQSAGGRAARTPSKNRRRARPRPRRGATRP